jgi:Mg-chelatase subunit ChlD
MTRPSALSPLRRAGAAFALVGVALGLMLGLLPVTSGASHPAPADAPAQPTSAARLSPCDAVLTTTLAADTIQLCEQTDVTVSVDPFCPVCPNGINVVFVQIDKAFEAPWMDAQSLLALDELERSNQRPEMKVGVVHYNSNQVVTKLRMTPNLNQARGPLSEPPYGHDPFGDVVGAATEALTMLRNERDNGVRQGDPQCEFIIFFASTKSIYTEQGMKMRDAANMIHRERVTLFVGCPETVADYCTYTKEMPKTAANYTEAPESGRLRTMVRNALRVFDEEPTMRKLNLHSVVPLGLQAIPDSFSLKPTQVETAPHTITYKVRPLQVRDFALRASMDLVDADGKVRVTDMPTMTLSVSGECPPDVTATPPPTITPTPVPPTPTPTATPRPKPIYLPIAVWEQCTVQWVYSDVALVIDMSTSMDRPTRDGGVSKEAAALAAAKSFLAFMDFTPNAQGQHDQVAVAGFNREAWIAQALSSDPDAITVAIDGLPQRQEQFTRLDLALERGAEALDPAHRMPGNTPVIILLTDGLPNQVPYAEDGTMETTVLRAAQAAKDAGDIVYTIGLGAATDINATLLAAAASGPDRYFYAPDAEDLSGVYTQIAYSFGCPKGRHDWSEPWP